MLIATYILKVYSTVQRAAKSKPPYCLLVVEVLHTMIAHQSLCSETGWNMVVVVVWYCYKKPILIYPPRWSTEITNKLFDMTL